MDSTEVEKKWLPLESTPEIFNKLASKLGFPKSELQFTDVFGLDADIWLGMMPQPIAAVILAFPIGEKHKEIRSTYLEETKDSDADSVFFIKQKIK
jgi:ubiquitin carboxyl-terminal hydrolase L3